VETLSAEHLTYEQAKAFMEEPKDLPMLGSSFQDEDDEDDDPRRKQRSHAQQSAKQSDTRRSILLASISPKLPRKTGSTRSWDV